MSEESVSGDRRRLGSAVGNGSYLPVEHVESSATTDFAKPFTPLPAPVTPPSSRRSHRRWYRRPFPLITVSLLTIVVGLLGYGVYQFESILGSVQSISTPPPVVTDSTYLEPDDPEAQSAPISVDTAPAQAYIAEQRESGAVPEEQGGGFFSAVSGIADTSGEMVMSGASALGLNDGSTEPITILLMGVDARPGSPIDIGVRPDAITVIRLDPVTATCRALSVPRDTRVDLPGYGETKINHALMVGGIPYQIRITEEFLDIDIDNYLLIDFVAFQTIVDSIGGITVDVPEDLQKNGETIYTEGPQTFDGATALAYARYRSFGTDGDYGRVERQWGVLEGIASNVQGQDMVGLATQTISTVKSHIRTDLQPEQITQLAHVYGQKCATSTLDDIAILRGSRVDLTDEMLNETASFNVVSGAAVVEAKTVLFATEPGDSGTSPAATPTSSPAAVSSTTQRSTARRRGGHIAAIGHFFLPKIPNTRYINTNTNESKTNFCLN